MANTPISGFTTATPTDADAAPFAQSPFGAGTNRKFTFSGLATYLSAKLASVFGGFSAPADPYISGNYVCPLPATTLSSSAAASAGEINLIPFIVRAPVTIKALMTRIITVSAGGNVGLAIYANNPTTARPTGLPLASVTGLSTATATNVSGTLGATVTLQPGMYWMASQRDNVTATFCGISGSACWMTALIGSATAANVLQAGTTALCFTYFGTYPTFPDFTAITLGEISSSRTAVLAFQVN